MLLALGLTPTEAGACQPYCPAGQATHIDADVPTDVGLRIVNDPCRSERTISDAKVIDAAGATVAGTFDSSTRRWRPRDPLVPGAAYTLVELTLAPDPRSLSFVAGPGPAPTITADELSVVATQEVFEGTSLCCDSGVCNYDARCLYVELSRRWRLDVRVGGEEPRWFQRVSAFDPTGLGKPKPKDPPPVAPLLGGEVCVRVRCSEGCGAEASRDVCLVLDQVAKPPNLCAEAIALYEDCDTPSPGLERHAIACGADEKGCAVSSTRGSYDGGASWMSLVLGAVVAAARRRWRVGRRAVNG